MLLRRQSQAVHRNRRRHTKIGINLKTADESLSTSSEELFDQGKHRLVGMGKHSDPRSTQFNILRKSTSRSGTRKSMSALAARRRSSHKPREYTFQIGSRTPATTSKISADEAKIESQLDEEEISEMDSSFEQIGSSSILEQSSLLETPDFLDTFRGLPSIETISCSLSFEDEVEEEGDAGRGGGGGDTGWMEDELYGEDESEMENEKDVGRPTTPREEDYSMSFLKIRENVEEELKRQEQPSEDDDELNILELQDVEHSKVDVFGQKLSIVHALHEQEKAMILESTGDFEKLKKIKLQEQLRERLEQDRAVINNLLQHLIDITCEYCELEMPTYLLAQNLDKHKLILGLQAVIIEFKEEQRIKHFLERKTVEHFRRKGKLRHISKDSREQYDDIINRYKESLLSLDKLLGEEFNLQTNTNNLIVQLKKDLDEAETRSLSAENDLDEFVRTTFMGDKRERLMANVETFLNRMHFFRNEISDVRIKLRRQNHDLADYKNRYEQMENIGNGLHLYEYEQIHTENLTLMNKIDERTHDTNRLRKRFSRDMNGLTHFKEHRLNKHTTVKVQRQLFVDLQQVKFSIRHKIMYLKSRRIKLKQELRSMSQQCGLLDKPALMRDYDEALVSIQQLQITNKILHIQHEHFLGRIATLEQNSEPWGREEGRKTSNILKIDSKRETL